MGSAARKHKGKAPGIGMTVLLDFVASKRVDDFRFFEPRGNGDEFVV